MRKWIVKLTRAGQAPLYLEDGPKGYRFGSKPVLFFDPFQARQAMELDHVQGQFLFESRNGDTLGVYYRDMPEVLRDSNHV